MVESVVIRENEELSDGELPKKTVVVKMPKRSRYGHMDMFESIKDR